MKSIPSGEVTFLFTDVQGSTVLWDQYADLMRDALAEHDRRLRGAVEERGGYVFTTAGDSFAVAFGAATDAVAAALEAQLSLMEPCGEIEIRVRMALHTGTAVARDGDYFGPVLNRCARLMSAGHGGQILVSASTANLVGEELADELRLIDLGERRLKDLSEAEHVFQLQHPDLPSDFPELRTLEGPWSNLPVQLTSFVGRDRELGEVRGVLDAGRLVTLTGSGGSGKTRLALHLAADSRQPFPDGVRLVELAAISDPDLIADEVAEVVGVQPSPHDSVLEAISSKIGRQRMLLVLDDCEHLVAPVGHLVMAVLAACPSLKVLATSRELLGIEGEASYRVPSLAIPSGSDVVTARDTDSVKLFTERATLADPGFAVTPDNVEAVIAICRRLDGIPLALELAAARLRVMSPSEVASRLDARFSLLGGTRGGLEHHRTLEAAIDWSHDLLGPDERLLFARLSAFAGNFTLMAAETVCSLEPLDSFNVLGLLSALVDKSMVVPDGGAGGETRYRLLETMRSYAAAKLGSAADVDGVSQRHADYYAGLSEGLQVKQRAGQIGEALALLDQDEDNVRAALRYSIDHGLPTVAARIVGAIGYLWYATGAFREGVDWAEQLLAGDPDLPDELLAPALHAYGTLLGSWAQPEVGIVSLEREVEIRRRLGDPARLGAALNNLGNLLDDVGRTDDARAALHAAIDQLRQAGESPSVVISSLGYGYLRTGDYESAERLFSEALDEGVVEGNEYEVALATSYLGQCAAHRGRLAKARSLLEEARIGLANLGIAPGVADADFNLAMVDRAEGRTEDAAGRLLAALESPDGHWYLATKFWILQVAASLSADRLEAAEILGVADAYYEKVEEAQPAFVLADLETVSQDLRTELGDEAFAAAIATGRRRSPAEGVASAQRVLGALMGHERP